MLYQTILYNIVEPGILKITRNRPSCSLGPSKEDMVMTKQLVKARAILRIKVLDHLIVQKKGYLSMKERGLLS